jgi:pectinesterase
MKIPIIALSVLIQLIFRLSAPGACNAIVDKNYTGVNGTAVNGIKTYSTIAAAVSAVSTSNASAYSIYIKNNRYSEHITMDRPYVTFIGQRMDSAVLTNNLAQGSANGSTQWGADCATLKIIASNFTAVNMTIENTFDYLGNMVKDTTDPTYIKSAQALAVRTASGSIKAFFKNCIISGYQDPLFAELGTQYYKKCVIKGAVDFIYGGGQAAFDSCDIICRSRPGKNPMGYITAPSTQIAQNYGLVFFNCNLKKEIASIPTGSYGLGRPWHPGASSGAADPNAVGMTIYMNCWMDGMIKTVGWDSMSGKDINGNKIWFTPYKTTDSRFYEYKSTGPGAIASANPPYRKFLTDAEAAQYTIANVLGGWLPDDNFGDAIKTDVKTASPPQIRLEKGGRIISLTIGEFETAASLSVFSIDGRLIRFSSLSRKTAGENVLKLDLGAGVPALGKGLYILRFRSNKRESNFRVKIA